MKNHSHFPHFLFCQRQHQKSHNRCILHYGWASISKFPVVAVSSQNTALIHGTKHQYLCWSSIPSAHFHCQIQLHVDAAPTQTLGSAPCKEGDQQQLLCSVPSPAPPSLRGQGTTQANCLSCRGSCTAARTRRAAGEVTPWMINSPVWLSHMHSQAPPQSPTPPLQRKPASFLST